MTAETKRTEGMRALIDAPMTDTWTCEQWFAVGIYTTAEYAAWCHPRTVRRCGTLNYVWRQYCVRCGMPQPAPMPTAAAFCAGLGEVRTVWSALAGER